jgi:hypothetical protein
LIDIIPVQLSGDKKTELIGKVYEKFWSAFRARQNQVDNSYVKWLNNYNAKPNEEVRTTPFYNASNFVPQLIRMHVDILMARISGIVFATKPLWKPTAILSDLPHEQLETLASAMQWASFYDIPGFQSTMFSVLKRCFKSGTTVLKYPWVSDSKWVVRQAGQAREIRREFLDFKPIPFDDFWVLPMTVMRLEDVHIKFQRVRLTKDEVEERAASGWWDKTAAEALIKTAEVKGEPAREAVASEADLQLKSDVVQPFTAIEAWLTYPTEERRPHSIVVVFNPQLKSAEGLLKCYYNPYDEDPFADFHMMPREELFYDYCVPEILEQAQEEQSQIHNGRRDASTITNTPGWKKKRGANVPNPATTWYPNKVFELDNMDDLEPLQLRPQYSAMLEEESSIMQQAERYTGVTPPMQGYGAGVMSGKRGIYNTGGTLALLAEGNRRLDMYIKQLRDPMHRVGRGIFTSYRDFGQAKLERFSKNEQYKVIQQLFASSREVDTPQGGGLFFELQCSDASVNKELDRTSLLLMANTMAAYYQRVFEGAGVVTQLPEGNPVRELMLLVLDGARDLASRILYAFDIPDRQRLVPDVRRVLEGGLSGTEQSPLAGGLPEASEPLSPDRLRQFSEGLAGLQGGGGAAPSNGQRPS